MTAHWDVIVVGGGLAGLAAGATAAKAGASTVVLTLAQPGGRARTTERDGFTFNMGAHALYRNGPGWSVLRRLDVQPVGSPPPLHRYRIRYKGGTHLFPATTSALLRTTALSAGAKAQLGRLLGGLAGLRPARLEGLSVAQWLAERGLRPDAAAVLEALVRLTTYSDDLADFGADAAVSQLQAGARHGVLYLDRGWAQLVEGLARQVEVRPGAAVRAVRPAAGRVEVHLGDGLLVAASVVLAAGSPPAVRSLLPADPGWGDLGDPVTAACLDVAAVRPPYPGWVVGADDPVFATTQAPPARQAPDRRAVVSVVRYGARAGSPDRRDLVAYLRHSGVDEADVLFERFLARMVVMGARPRPSGGGLRGRPSIDATGLAGVFLAGDWVGPDGLLADAALASGQAAGLAAVSAAEQVARRPSAGPATVAS
jgi:phytoene dehydrogenase-like protein